MHRTVTGTVRRPDETPWTNAQISFQLQSGSYTPSTQYPSATLYALTDSEGKFSIELWANEEGDKSSRYLCRLPDGKGFGFTVPTGSTPIELSVLRAAGATESEPQYNTLVTYVQGLVASQTGNSIKVPFSWGDASPKAIATWQGKIYGAAVVVETAFNAPSELRLGDASDPERLIPSAYIDPSQPARYEVGLALSYSTSSQVLLTIIPGSGISAGSGFVILEV